MSAAPRIVSIEMEDHTCGICGILFSAPAAFWAERRTGGAHHEKGWYCPNGHSRVFRETENDKLTRELNAAKRDAEWQRQLRDRADKSLIAQRGENTKLRKRISNGVCPCCKRSFGNLRKHMTTKHPDYTTAGQEPRHAD